MSRSGYVDDYVDDNLQFGRWRGVVASSIRGRRGQVFLTDLLRALDAMPEKRLIAEALDRDGEVCALGALAAAKKIDVSTVDPENYDVVASLFDIAECLAQEVAFHNDEAWGDLSPERRWVKMRAWVAARVEVWP